MSIDKKLTFGEIWKVLAKEDVSKYTQEKGKLTYLSWARAWILLMKHYPESEYSFHDFDGLPFRTLPDGTAEVVTSLNIDGRVRSMALPIMDYKNNAVVNPSATQVNNNRMRCLVKNIAMFGLGMSVYASLEPEDLAVDPEEGLPDEKHDVKPAGKKSAKKTKKKVRPKSDMPEAKEMESLIPENPDLDWAETFVEACIDMMNTEDTKEGLRELWKNNEEQIGLLKAKFPEQKAELEGVFVAKAKSIAEEEKN
jgi:hypothetical protein